MAEAAPTSTGPRAAVVAAAAAAAAAAAEAESRRLKRKPKEGPNLRELIIRAVEAASDGGVGVSSYAVKKALVAFGLDMEKRNSRFNSTIKLLVEQKVLVRASGTGAAGSYRINKNRPAPKLKKKSAAAKKEAARKEAARKRKKKLAANKAARKKREAEKRAEKKKKEQLAAREACSGRPGVRRSRRRPAHEGSL